MLDNESERVLHLVAFVTESFRHA